MGKALNLKKEKDMKEREDMIYNTKKYTYEIWYTIVVVGMSALTIFSISN